MDSVREKKAYGFQFLLTTKRNSMYGSACVRREVESEPVHFVLGKLGRMGTNGNDCVAKSRSIPETLLSFVYTHYRILKPLWKEWL
ncbi:hypothetical protein CDAR_240721 [Caerostris darwini]|uniref:Uncharacterized protein n=1 Tax=Caerostris darwini TaxID=1538125 RepID=A0AAV4S197_9ARAC|nr:hypothetical protein CDAR_240721 [Caerostris darwini]